ncbi:MAG: helix-turn-helix transcriptional regulator [Dehalococcoidia bacterium]|uniref:response regulator transcription factor n=1 Tax=Candidatus Amarobacter glycogenicus TaxID=3140699 RepID=UPI003136D1FC|nr:helix-turn-helix transcriptional regulator [Dehalococcoidia bacterium]
MASPWSRRQRGRPPYPLLTPAEERVLAHLRRGLTNAEIAVRLGVSLDAVKYHVSNMLGKLGLQNREQLAEWREPSRPRRMWAGIPAVVKIGLVTAAGVAVVAVVHAFATRTEPESETLFQGLVTVGFDGAPANGPSRNAHLSTDGRYLVFESDASNLVKDDRNGGTDVFRFDRRERKLQLLTDLAPGSASAVSSSGPSVSANGDVVAFIVAGANPFFGGIRLWENGTSGLRNFSDVPTLVASVSPRGDLVAAVQLEQSAAQTLAALEVRDVRSGDTVWRTPLEPALDAGTPGFSSDGRWLVFAASSVPEARCEPLLREVLIGDSVNALPVARPFVHDFLTGETWCPSITPTDGTVIVDFGIAAVSGDAAAFAFMSGETVAGSGGTRILVPDWSWCRWRRAKYWAPSRLRTSRFAVADHPRSLAEHWSGARTGRPGSTTSILSRMPFPLRWSLPAGLRQGQRNTSALLSRATHEAWRTASKATTSKPARRSAISTCFTADRQRRWPRPLAGFLAHTCQDTTRFVAITRYP